MRIQEKCIPCTVQQAIKVANMLFFLLMTKCKVIVDDIGVEVMKMICMKNIRHLSAGKIG